MSRSSVDVFELESLDAAGAVVEESAELQTEPAAESGEAVEGAAEGEWTEEPFSEEEEAEEEGEDADGKKRGKKKDTKSRTLGFRRVAGTSGDKETAQGEPDTRLGVRGGGIAPRSGRPGGEHAS